MKTPARPTGGNGEALRIARELVATLATIGARAVVLLGSHARGDAHRESDIDLYALGEAAGRPEYRLERHGGYLVSLSWRAVERERAAFRSPEEAGGAVPAWRTAVILHDPDGIAAALRREALAWHWELLDPCRCDEHVAEWLAGLAEEVHKLVVSLERGVRWTAAAQRSVLVLRLARLLALHHRMLYDSENDLWDLVAARMGERWPPPRCARCSTTGSTRWSPTPAPSPATPWAVTRRRRDHPDETPAGRRQREARQVASSNAASCWCCQYNGRNSARQRVVDSRVDRLPSQVA